MSDLIVTYDGSTIVSENSSVEKILKTNDKMMVTDVELKFTYPMDGAIRTLRNVAMTRPDYYTMQFDLSSYDGYTMWSLDNIAVRFNSLTVGNQNAIVIIGSSKAELPMTWSYNSSTGLLEVTVPEQTGSEYGTFSYTTDPNDVDIIIFDPTIETKLQNKIVNPSSVDQTITPDSEYDGLGKVTVTAMSVETPAISIIGNEQNAIVTATANELTTTESINLADSLSGSCNNTTGLITVTGAKSTSASHQITSADDPDLIASNILKDVTLFGVTGIFEPGGSGGVQYAYGTFTSLTSSATRTITHNLGVTPKRIWIMPIVSATNPTGELASFHHNEDSLYIDIQRRSQSFSQRFMIVTDQSYGITSVTDTAMTLKAYNGTYAWRLNTYLWVVAAQ